MAITDKQCPWPPEYTSMRVAPVSETVQSELLHVAQQATEPKGAVLFRRNEPAFGIFLVRKGSVSLRLEAEEEDPFWERIVTGDSIVGLPATLSGGRYSLTAIVLEDSELAFVERSVLLDLIRNNPAIGLELMRALSEEVVQMRNVLVSTPRAT